jgi:hypothetical protein
MSSMAKRPTATTKRVWVPDGSFFAHFQDPKSLKKAIGAKRFKAAYPAVTLPVDWTMNNTLSFPIDGNDHYGDCMYAAACHGDNTFTGNNGAESSFDLDVIIQDYLALSGGDNGLTETQIVGEWKRGLANTPAAIIYDSLDIDPTDTSAMQAAIYLFGGVQYMLDVPDAWITAFQSAGGFTWGTPATPDSANGHGIWLNGVDDDGNYELQTWGSWGWLTPDAVAVPELSLGAFTVFSPRWFNSAGVAPNGRTYDELAQLWVQCGGSPVPSAPTGRRAGSGGSLNISIPLPLQPGNYVLTPAKKG